MTTRRTQDLAALDAPRIHTPAGIALSKRALDLALALMLAVPVGVVACCVAIAVLAFDGGPVMYRAQRVGQNGRLFTLYKFRSMRRSARDRGVTGGDKRTRISRIGRALRRYRLDEIPQLLNVLRGDMSLVGPRPPDPRYVALYPEVYAEVLETRPGVTGLSTLHMHRFEDRVLGACTNEQQTEDVYCRRCIPRKARLDRIYARRQYRPGAVWFDCVLMGRTIMTLLR